MSAGNALSTDALAAAGLRLTPDEAELPATFDPDDADDLQRAPATEQAAARALSTVSHWPPFTPGEEANDGRHVPKGAILKTGDVIESLRGDAEDPTAYEVVVGGGHEDVVVWVPGGGFQSTHVEGIVSDAGWGELAVHRGLITATDGAGRRPMNGG
ncbi:MAG: hypothetical protein ACI9CA_000010 [Natronomonas sp.]|jgi:hypothetical protein